MKFYFKRNEEGVETNRFFYSAKTVVVRVVKEIDEVEVKLLALVVVVEPLFLSASQLLV